MKYLKVGFSIFLLMISNIIPIVGPLFVGAIILGVYSRNTRKTLQKMIDEDDPENLIRFKVIYRRAQKIYLNDEMKIKCEQAIDRWERKVVNECPNTHMI